MYNIIFTLFYFTQQHLNQEKSAGEIMENTGKLTTTRETTFVVDRDTDPSDLVLPIDMRFNEGHIVGIVTYSVLFVISAIGNTTVLILINKRRQTAKSRINTMLMHLAIADLLVTCLLMPLEIGWAITVSWKAGDTMCRVMSFFRVFGLYLSSFILICISIDRYYAVLRPLQLADSSRRGKVMLISAWMSSILCSLPQMLVFHVETHPVYTWYQQCITYNSFPTYTHEVYYSLFVMVTMYCIPLTVIIYTYTSILLEIYKRSRVTNHDGIRRSSLGFLGKAKIRTLKMTIIIVTVFFICWTPYYVMSLWYWIDKSSASQVDQRIQKGLFIFACTNSCMNPIVYGIFNIRNRTKDSVNLQDIRPPCMKLPSVMRNASWKKKEPNPDRRSGIIAQRFLEPAVDVSIELEAEKVVENTGPNTRKEE